MLALEGGVEPPQGRYEKQRTDGQGTEGGCEDGLRRGRLFSSDAK